MTKDIDEKIGARSQKNWYGLKYKNPLKNYRVHEMPTGDQLPPHYITYLYTYERLREAFEILLSSSAACWVDFVCSSLPCIGSKINRFTSTDIFRFLVTPCLIFSPPFLFPCSLKKKLSIVPDVTRFLFEAVFDFKLPLMMAVSCIFHLLAISPCNYKRSIWYYKPIVLLCNHAFQLLCK